MALLLSKLAWNLFAPGSFLALLLCAGLGMIRLRKTRAGYRLIALVAFAYLALAALPVGSWALTPLENRFAFDPPAHVDGIIMLGGDEQAQISESRGMPVALDSMRRALTFADLARRYPQAKLVFSGGQVFPETNAKLVDADVARALLKQMGAPVERIIFEKQSRTTWENAALSADLVHPAPEQNWLLVTSAWHMTRAMGCFRRAGWHVDAAPTGYFTTGAMSLHPRFSFDEQMHMLTLAAHEYVGLVVYRLLGRTNALWPE